MSPWMLTCLKREQLGVLFCHMSVVVGYLCQPPLTDKGSHAGNNISHLTESNRLPVDTEAVFFSQSEQT